jgi:hypothetical protein
MDLLLVCEEDMMPETPEGGATQAPANISEILRRRQLSIDLKFGNTNENGPHAKVDETLLQPRVLYNLLKIEEVLHSQISPMMFTFTQDKVTPSMRCDTCCWLFEVGLRISKVPCNKYKEEEQSANPLMCVFFII